MITKTHDKSLLKDALAKAQGVLISTYANGDENPDALDRLPWERNVELEQLGILPSPEYVIFVLLPERDAMIFRGFPTRESAQDALQAAGGEVTKIYFTTSATSLEEAELAAAKYREVGRAVRIVPADVELGTFSIKDMTTGKMLDARVRDGRIVHEGSDGDHIE